VGRKAARAFMDRELPGDPAAGAREGQRSSGLGGIVRAMGTLQPALPRA
jgi:hypothetical protein